MAEEKSKEEEMRENELILENHRFIKKYGLSKKELEKLIQRDLKNSNSFSVIANYLIWARDLLFLQEVKRCKQFIERAKYILNGCDW